MSNALKCLALFAIFAATSAPAKDTVRPAYLDNRSTAVDLLDSYYNAIALGQYARAFTYTLRSTPDETAQDISAAYGVFRDGFDGVVDVRMRRGTGFESPGAGLEMTAIPVVFELRDEAGTRTLHAACHYLVQLSPDSQDLAPFEPIRLDHTQPEAVSGDFAHAAMPDCRF